MANVAQTDSLRTFDPGRSGKYGVVLSNGLASSTSSKDGLTTVAFNHKPSQTGSKRRTRIRQEERPNTRLELSIVDEDDAGSMRCTYSGRRRDPTDTYILTFDRDRQTFHLDALGSAYDFNMTSAPWESDKAKLAEQYKQIEISEPDNSPFHGAPSGTDDEMSAVESDVPSDTNPFDYRHYLNGLPNTGTESRIPSNASTPLLGPRAGPASPTASTRFSSSTPQAVRHAPPKGNHPIKPQRVQFKAQASKNRRNSLVSDDDASFLIIGEGSALPAAKKRRIALPKGGPRSLHAAAQAAKAARPAPPSPPQQDAGSGYEEDNESDEPKGANDDVDDLTLPEPASARPRPPARRQSTWEDGDEEALQAALEEAFMGDEDEDDEAVQEPSVANGSKNKAHESESESEEE